MERQTLSLKGLWSFLDHHLNKLGGPCVPNVIYHETVSKFSFFLEKKIFKFLFVFYHIETFEQIELIPQKAQSEIW